MQSMKRIYIDYTHIGGNSYQIGLMDEHNLSTTYFMTVIWSDDNSPQIIIPSTKLLHKQCYDEISSILYSINSDQEEISKKKLSDILLTNGYTKNPLN